MNKNLLKEMLLIAVNNKEEVLTILDGIDSKHGDRGFIKITENFVNISSRDLVFNLAQDKLEDYNVAFRGGKIYLEVVAKMIFKAKARIVINIESLIFEPKRHELTISYERDGITVANNFIPKILEKLAEANPGKISLEGNLILIDLDQWLESPPWLALKYMEADMGAIKFAFRIV